MNLFKSSSFYLAMLGFVAAFFFFQRFLQEAPPASFIQKPSFIPYNNYIAASGIVEALDKNIYVGSPEDGIVEKLWVKVGDQVKKGDPLFQLDTRLLSAKLQVQKTNLDVEKSKLEKLNNRLIRFQEVNDPRAITRDDLLSLEDDVRIAKANVMAAQAEINQTEQTMDRLLVRSPISGEVLQVDFREGEYLKSDNSKIVLGNLERFQIRVSIDEQGSGHFNPESPAVAYPKNNTTIRLPLHFVRVEPFVVPKTSLTGASDERVDTRVLQVIYSFDSLPHFRIYVGQQMDVYIENQKASSSDVQKK